MAHLKTKRPVISRFTGPETLSTAIRRGGAAPCEALPRTYPQWVAQFNTVFRLSLQPITRWTITRRNSCAQLGKTLETVVVDPGTCIRIYPAGKTKDVSSVTLALATL